MPPAGPKSDINRSGAEVTDFPAVCNDCLSATDNPFIQMIKEDRGLECKICTRPFTVFRWAADRTSRFKKTNICLTCARLKNCCQCCMLDLSFGLPIAVRDAALKLVAQGPSSGINKEYYAQNHEGALVDGQVPEEYDKTDAAARDLLKKLAGSEPYYRRKRGGGEGSSSGGGGGGEGGGGVGPHRGHLLRVADERACIVAVAREGAVRLEAAAGFGFGGGEDEGVAYNPRERGVLVCVEQWGGGQWGEGDRPSKAVRAARRRWR
ncbi:hypothetical protein P167DRAFT_567472 [Morchella conica CCBAS932]|uniref:STL11/RBM22-like N-terminal domain-containing protein n=1 Tax=Morchella conica CCBAS932 TaxID=1392247 RepID=A0A3N4KI52_9PEZI|nr:hypothetical protein P167DRAFT_567472 [Morchella conica CCBAS932]